MQTNRRFRYHWASDPVPERRGEAGGMTDRLATAPRHAAEDSTPAEASGVLTTELEAARRRPSGRIPPERELAARHGLSRTVVRRWLDRLERSGQITRHVGRGTFVTRARQAEAADTSPAEILAVRLIVEPQMLGLAIANATARDIAEMRHCLAESEAAGSYEEFERWDSGLHAAIAASTHNTLMIRLFTVMNEARHDPLWGSAKRRSFTPQRRAEYEQDHRELVDAIDDRHLDRAATVMRRHLQRIRTALIGTHT
jgi:DNA-binding FadR family transcriptional regulator